MAIPALSRSQTFSLGVQKAFFQRGQLHPTVDGHNYEASEKKLLFLSYKKLFEI